MSEEPPSPKGGFTGRIVGIVVLSLVLFLLLPAANNFVFLDLLFHFAMGWAIHAMRNLPVLVIQWHGLILPFCCLAIAVILLHRFVLWWLSQKASEVIWRPRNTMATVGVLLGISLAAVAMSGITHQSAWLTSEPLIEDRGGKTHRAAAVSNAKQLMLGLYTFYDDNGRYPESLQELKEAGEMLDRLPRAEPKRGTPPESYVLLKPGGKVLAKNDEPLLLSPYLPETGEYAVAFGDGSVTLIKEPELEELLAKEKR